MSDPYLSETTINLWLWLFPITYLFHIAEEYWGGEGYSSYLLKLRGVHLSQGRFLFMQSIGVVLMVAGIFLARRLGFPNMLSVILGAIVLVNGITHTLTSALNHGYGPGLISSLLLWIPFGVATMFQFHGSMSEPRYWLSAAIGVGINAAIALFTMRGGRFG